MKEQTTKELGYNSTFIEINEPLNVCIFMVGEFAENTFSNGVFMRIGTKDKTVTRVLYTYKIGEVTREVANLVHRPDICNRFIIISNFAKERFIEYLETNKIQYVLRKDEQI